MILFLRLFLNETNGEMYDSQHCSRDLARIFANIIEVISKATLVPFTT
uniref:Uncharacterized protein n=1 Tax=Anguilla anguilla TaxID=7936 RepID=A0A0E9UXM9_ANGAN